MAHLQKQTALDFLSGRLGAAEATTVRDHVDSCDVCRELVAHLQDDLPRAELDAGSTVERSVQTTAADVPSSLRERARLPARQIEEYRLIRLLGRGGMGSVYLAHDTLLDRQVALKLIAGDARPHVRERFLVEARAVARIKHPNVVAVYRVGEDAGRPFVVYELVRGRGLDSVAKPIPWAKALEFAIAITRGLTAAHTHGVLHRDIKPANIMLAEGGEVILVDFGLARIADDEGAGEGDPGSTRAIADLALTATGTRLGTPRYMPPEAWLGEPATAASDVYSLGVVVFELLAGRPPFTGASPAELGGRVVRGDAPPLRSVAPSVPAALAAAVDRCLMRDPGDRFPSADAVRDALEAFEVRRSLEVVNSSRRAAAPAGNPYRGTQRFETEHQALFFGRRSELRTLVDLLHGSPFVLVTGGARTGKSSLCRAGLMPLIENSALGGARSWDGITVTPGLHPLAALCAGLAPHMEATPAAVEAMARSDPDEMVRGLRRGHGGCSAHALLIDPLDELITTSDPEEAAFVSRLLARLAQPGPTVRLLGTCRPELLTQVAALPELGPAIGAAPYLLVEPRSEAALREIIVGPARLAGAELEPALVDSLLEEFRRGELRLEELELTLAELWERRDPATAVVSANSLEQVRAGSRR